MTAHSLIQCTSEYGRPPKVMAGATAFPWEARRWGREAMGHAPASWYDHVIVAKEGAWIGFVTRDVTPDIGNALALAIAEAPVRLDGSDRSDLVQAINAAANADFEGDDLSGVIDSPWSIETWRNNGVAYHINDAGGNLVMTIEASGWSFLDRANALIALTTPILRPELEFITQAPVAPRP